MKTIIIDDEPVARQTIELLLNDFFSEINIVGTAGSVSEGVEIIKKHKPGLVFLDIDLTDGTGFDILKSLHPVDFKVIFITAHQEYAVKAIKYSAFDFILKPVSAIELTEAVNRALEDVKKETEILRWKTFFENISLQKNEDRKIVLKTAESIHIVVVNDIIRCEADNNYSTFFLKSGEKIVISKGLKEYEELLEDDGFFRVHQSHLINLNYIVRYDKKDGGFVVLADNSHIPVSQRKKQKLLEFFDKMG